MLVATAAVGLLWALELMFVSSHRHEDEPDEFLARLHLEGTNQSIPLILISTRGLNGAIFPAERGNETGIASVGGYYTPTTLDIDRLASTLRLHLEALRDEGGPRSRDAGVILGRYSDYRCQYLGYWEGGARKVLISCFSTAAFTDLNDYWYRAWVWIVDGGSFVWRALYDLESGRVESFEVNGEA